MGEVDPRLKGGGHISQGHTLPAGRGKTMGIYCDFFMWMSMKFLCFYNR